MYITDYTGSYELASDISVQVWNGWRLCQRLIVNLQKSGIDIRHLSFSNDMQYIILQQWHIPVIGRQCPPVFSIQFYILIYQILQRLTVRYDNTAFFLFQFDFCFSYFSFVLRILRIPYLFPFSLCIFTVIYDTIFVIFLLYRSHAIPPLFLPLQ